MATIDFKPGDLLEVVRHKCHTLCKTGKPYLLELRECPVEELEVRTYPAFPDADIFENLEGKVVLVVDVAKNLLDQVVGYRVLFDGKEIYCKSLIAKKYFKLLKS